MSVIAAVLFIFAHRGYGKEQIYVQADCLVSAREDNKYTNLLPDSTALYSHKEGSERTGTKQAKFTGLNLQRGPNEIYTQKRAIPYRYSNSSNFIRPASCRIFFARGHVHNILCRLAGILADRRFFRYRLNLPRNFLALKNKKQSSRIVAVVSGSREERLYYATAMGKTGEL